MFLSVLLLYHQYWPSDALRIYRPLGRRTHLDIKMLAASKPFFQKTSLAGKRSQSDAVGQHRLIATSRLIAICSIGMAVNSTILPFAALLLSRKSRPLCPKRFVRDQRVWVQSHFLLLQKCRMLLQSRNPSPSQKRPRCTHHHRHRHRHHHWNLYHRTH